MMMVKIEEIQDLFLPQHVPVEELDEADKRLIRQCRHKSFSGNIGLLKEDKPIKNRSKLLQLSPALDDCELLILSGSTDFATCMTARTK
ncbi:hypothetical protein JTB14_031388 [Gonioctena quinquepunctata]|nr:hypothetical protein JTB14_031388 [Gonioctena quinquepunctata]